MSNPTADERIDLTPAQLRVLIGIVRGERIGREPQRPGKTTRKKIRVLEKRGLVTVDCGVVSPTEAAHEMVEKIGV